MSLNNGRLIQEDDNNETRTLCFKCIALLLEARKVEAHQLSKAQKLEAHKAAMLAVPPPTARVEAIRCRKPKNLRPVKLLC